MTTFQLFKRNNVRFYYRIISDSGHNVMSSDGYERKQECINAIAQVKNIIKNMGNIQIEEIEESQYRFILTGADNSIIGYSMPFNSKNQCTKWIKLMQQYLPVSATIELEN